MHKDNKFFLLLLYLYLIIVLPNPQISIVKAHNKRTHPRENLEWVAFMW